jgi:hypothetical protein
VKEGFIMHISTSNHEVLQLGAGNYTCNWGTYICGGIITQNPYYTHLDKWLAENAPQFLTPSN